MTSTDLFFTQLLDCAVQSNHRYGVVLQGDSDWQQRMLAPLLQSVPAKETFCLGADIALEKCHRVAFNKGHQLLGRECQLLLCDFEQGFDANSFSAATGCIVGGGLLVILTKPDQPSSYDQQWLSRALNHLMVVTPYDKLPSLPKVTPKPVSAFKQQDEAVEKILKVVDGHRKRPLVITADRGRGKSSALGIAAAKMMQSRRIHIVVTAPSLSAVKPLFVHAARLLPEAEQASGRLRFQDSTLEFIAPDELIRAGRIGDCLMVDEASAIPIPMLQSMVELHHRAIFSTTIHGYEGCGRGFTVKFQSWLKTERPGCVFYHINQPIRWNDDDPLERWLFDSFLLNAELAEFTQSRVSNIALQPIDKRRLIEQPHLLRACFALLVNAHYQTTPNDLMLLLADDAIQLYAHFEQQHCIGCLLTVEEGGLAPDLISEIQLGKRRPRGHLVPVTLANHLGIAEAAQQRSLRVMRIAVHPELQGQGIGKRMLRQLREQTDYDFYSTSFGATAGLIQFWCDSGFYPVRLGHQRDQASGCHSIMMLQGETSWRRQVEQLYFDAFCFALSDNFASLETEVVRSLLAHSNASVAFPSGFELVEHYLQGGASFETIAPLLDLWWKRAPRHWQNASPLLIRKVIQRRSWGDCVQHFNLVGRKQAEAAFREQLSHFLSSIRPAN
ncbi:tRNA(Met) cytidine acetyltransferase [Vibrio sp. JPW-9-11-11]|uniref:tRNA(Met) cytidine acetyltransferase TmcA n=1 Tax=Vibrio sp. JPW-9-11-11 TaxID=1416532 RepID=UPI0015930D2A|nr:GNAT family N-acetyltransferase [Vibrio sp. JPW-9-11-11]NVD08631.1 tRNA(Met) cytidine acetyltransferase [Vibrio sp. JPW-9-11-11]